MSWTWKFMQQPWTLPRRMRRTTGKQTRFEIQSRLSMDVPSIGAPLSGL